MYAPFFGLKREPFSIAPDPRYLFMSERHRDALAHLLYGVGGGGGFVLLTGEIGAGKTTVCRCFLEQIPRRCNVAYIFNPKLTVEELLKSVCDEFHIPLTLPAGTATVKDYLDPLNEFLLKTHAVGQNNVLIIDEAQSLSADVLEQLRLLTNLETSERKLLQIILIGQPELRSMLARPELEQLAQRVIARFHLEALSPQETGQYIRHRLAVAGLPKSGLFPDALIARIHHWSRGVPRRINLLCDRALLGAYAQGRNSVDRDTLDKAAAEVFGHSPMPMAGQAITARTGMPRWGWPVVATSVLFGVTALTLMVADTLRSSRNPGQAAPTAAPGTLPLARASSAPTRALTPAASSLTLVPTGLLAAMALPEPAQGQVTALIGKAAQDEGQAWQDLAMLWDERPLTGPYPCQSAAGRGLQCFKSDDGLALIRQLGRPAILKLQDTSGRTGYVLLTGLRGQLAVLQVGSQIHAVPLQALAEVWLGDFGTLWRAPPSYSGKLARGASGPAVDRLAAQLAAWRGEPPPWRASSMDADMVAQVTAFQAAQGLQSDGVAGAVTFMRLNRATGVNEPRLQTDPQGR